MQPKKSDLPQKAAKPAPASKPKLVSSKLAYKGRVFNVYADTVIEANGHKHVREVDRKSGV